MGSTSERHVIFGAALVVAVAVIFHWASTFVYLPYSGFVVLAVGVMGVLLGRTPTWVSFGAALPWFPITLRNKFYRDCEAIDAGMSVTAVRERMTPYFAQNESREKPASSSKLDTEHLTFHPSKDMSSDWCVVYVADGHVVEVEALPD